MALSEFGKQFDLELNSSCGIRGVPLAGTSEMHFKNNWEHILRLD